MPTVPEIPVTQLQRRGNEQGQPSERVGDELESMHECVIGVGRCGDVDAAGTAGPDHGTGSPPGLPPCLGGCQYRHARYDGPVKGWCERPSRLVCVDCRAWHLKRCGSARASRCEHCAEEHRRDVSAIGRSGWTDRPSDRGYWVTLTAPGFDWDTSQCHHSAGVECSGTIGCVSDPQQLALWHHRLGQRWSWFVRELRRVLGVDVEFFKTYELQKRGALHVHCMLRVGPGVTDRRVKAAVRMVSRLGHVNFGTQHKVEVIDLSRSDLSSDQQTARTAGYCAKYATKSADALPDVQRLDGVTGELHSGGFRAWSASRAWGVTMRQCKERRRAWAASVGTQASAASDAAAGAVGALTCNGIATDPTLPTNSVFPDVVVPTGV